MPRSDEEQGTRAALKAVALTGVVLTLAAPFVLGKPSVLGVALGSGIATLNLWALGRVVRALMAGASLPWVALGGLKLLALLGVMALIIKYELAGLLPLGAGYAALPLGIVLSQLAGARTPALSSSDKG